MLSVDQDELRAVIGPNGAGKTTLLDLICGRTKGADGQDHVQGPRTPRPAEHEIVRAGIGRKFQTPSIYEYLTVFENLEMSLPARPQRGSARCSGSAPTRSSSGSRRSRERSSFQDHLDRPAETLSHGQKQWLEIGMLLIQDPELLMLDEPVAGMSVAEREKTAELLNRISKNRALIVIEHDMEFVESIAHR